MSRQQRRKAVTGLALATVLAMGAATAHAADELPALPPELAKLRASLDKYRDPYVAIRDGYFSTIACIDYPKVSGDSARLPYRTGGMGIHFLNMQFVGPEPDPEKPPILLYEPDGDRLKLVGVEWFVPLATGVKQRPAVLGQPFDGPMLGHEPVMPEGLHHYDLHAWLWKANPNGLFSGTNPDLKCDGYHYTVTETDAPHLAPTAQ